MKFFRGNTFFKVIHSETYTFQKGDKLHIVVMKNAYSDKYLYEEIKEIQAETNEIEFEILPEKTAQFPIGKLLLEIELTTKDGIVETNQYDLEVEADGIHGKN